MGSVRSTAASLFLLAVIGRWQLAYSDNDVRLEWTLGPCIFQLHESCDDIKIRFLLYPMAEDEEVERESESEMNLPPSTYLSFTRKISSQLSLLDGMTCLGAEIKHRNILYGKMRQALYSKPPRHPSSGEYRTGNGHNEPSLLHTSDPNPPPGTFNPSLPTKMIIHGYAGHAEFNVTAIVRRAYLTQEDCNVIVVDWGPLAKQPCYFTAIFNIWQVGICTTQLLLGLVTKFKIQMATVHAVGFSLGAHVAAIASNGIFLATGYRLGRITGLDPALPLFATLNDGWKLDADDADFVDVIHTNVGVFGKIEVSGHADFFVNGGSFQPACTGNSNEPLCSHLLAPVYFAESISSETGFWGEPCPSYWYYILGWCSSEDIPDQSKMLMGEKCHHLTRGIFFVYTSDSPPYALGKHRNLKF